jgi:erythromycin esterase-like protein
MKNNECIIYISTKQGYTQIYRREKDGWTQTSPNGKVRKLSAEQLLSHMLPSLAGVGPLNIRVKKK